VSLCLAAAGLAIQMAATEFSLSWTHTVERTRWEEHWRVTDAGLDLIEARVKGSGAGMEPPPGARLENGFYIWQPELPPQREIALRRAAGIGDWELCAGGRCGLIRDWLGGAGDPVTLRACVSVRGEKGG
jgi:hypothetical protein